MMTAFNQPQSHAATTSAKLLPILRKPQRISITLHWQLHQQLLERSNNEGRSLSNLAAHLLEVSCSD